MKIKHILLITLLSVAVSHTCKGALNAKVMEKDVGITTNRMLSEEWGSMRVHLDFTSLNKNKTATKEQKEAIVKVMNDAKYALEHLLGVRRLAEKLTYNVEDACSYSEHVGPEASEGVDADLVIVVDAWTDAPMGAVAGAAPCSMVKGENRPIIGWTGFVLDYIDHKKEDFYKTHFDTAIHEIVHILGFTNEMYDKMKDVKVVDFKATDGGKAVTYKALKGTKMIEYARRHFGCDSIEALPLENGGSSGTAGSHWEHRYLMGDFMTGYVHLGSVISDITLGFLEDSGWYKPHYYTGGLYKNQKRKGCGFFEKFCRVDGKFNFTDTYCFEKERFKCDPNHHFVGSCDGNEAESTSNEGCPKPAFFERSSSFVNSGDCRANIPVNSDAVNSTGVTDTFSARSTCFEANVSKQDKNVKHRIARCFVPVCHKEFYTVQVEQTTIKCPPKGGFVEVPGYNGKIECLSYVETCGKTTECYDVMTCIKQKSHSIYHLDEISTSFAYKDNYDPKKPYDASFDFKYGQNSKGFDPNAPSGTGGNSGSGNGGSNDDDFGSDWGDFGEDDKGEDDKGEDDKGEDDKGEDDKGEDDKGEDDKGEEDDFGSGWGDFGNEANSTLPDFLDWIMENKEHKKKYDCMCTVIGNKRMLAERLENKHNVEESSDSITLTKTQGVLIMVTAAVIQLLLTIIYIQNKKIAMAN